MHEIRIAGSTSRNRCVKILPNEPLIIVSEAWILAWVTARDSRSRRVMLALGRDFRDSASSWRCARSRASAFARATRTSDVTSCRPASVAATRTDRARTLEKSATRSDNASKSDEEAAPGDSSPPLPLFFRSAAPSSSSRASKRSSASLLSRRSLSQNSR